jgi:hypothetical protein
MALIKVAKFILNTTFHENEAKDNFEGLLTEFLDDFEKNSVFELDEFINYIINNSEDFEIYEEVLDDENEIDFSYTLEDILTMVEDYLYNENEESLNDDEYDLIYEDDENEDY